MWNKVIKIKNKATKAFKALTKVEINAKIIIVIGG